MEFYFIFSVGALRELLSKGTFWYQNCLSFLNLFVSLLCGWLSHAIERNMVGSEWNYIIILCRCVRNWYSLKTVSPNPNWSTFKWETWQSLVSDLNGR